jgi:glycine/D-amino acid oxidase-like deaminating enzyme
MTPHRSLHGSRIYWLERGSRSLRPTLVGHHEADVAVIGGGFTGLWTAYHLLESDPSMRVAVLEREDIGFGASGRNGGFAMTLLDMSLAHLRRNQGDDAARAAHAAVAASVDEIAAFTEQHGIDCELVRGGLLVVATNRGQLERVEADAAAADALGLTDVRILSRAEVRAEVDSPAYLGGLTEEHCAVLDPARLTWGLADVVEGMGATVAEVTDVTGIHEFGDRVRVETSGGQVVADQVVLATNAWARETPWFRRKVVPLFTYIVLTEPISDEQWASVGWARRQGIEDKRNYVHYYRRTADGRILWGGSDGVVHAGGRIQPSYDRNPRVLRRLQQTFRRTFPQLADVRFTHHWGGPVGITPDFLPLFGTLLGGRLHYGLGYNGHGVAPSHTGGKILRDKVLGRTTDHTALCFVDHREAAFPPEPLRWISAELTRQTLLRQDRQFDAGRGSGEMDPLLMRAMRRLT